MKKQITFILLLLTQIASAQVSFTASAEKVVQVGETFRLVYRVNANVSGFEGASLKDFEVLSGPNSSTSQSFEYINGKSTQSITNAFTYYLRAQKEGTFTLAPGRAVVNGKEYKSNSLQIKVIKGEKPKDATQKTQNADINDLFLRVIVSKNNLYEGEALTATVKLYTRVDLVGINDLDFPKYPGFFIKTIYNADRINLERETYNGKIYNTAILRRELLFPQKSGKLTVGKANIELVVRQITGKGRNFFGQIVNRYENIQRNISSLPVKINVQALPAGTPDDFSGLVGENFSVETTIEKTKLKTDESSKLKIKVSGEGNLHLLDDINVLIPPEIDNFPEKKDKVTFNAAGSTGYKEYTYLLIPRSPGKYRIPAIDISYFDTKNKTYKTISSKEIILDVEKGENYDTNNSSRPAQEIAQGEANDIRYIKQNNPDFRKSGDKFANSLLYYLSLLVSIVLFFIIIFLKKRNERLHNNITDYKNRKAAKISRKKLQTANKLLKAGKADEFYKEIISALWSYTANKFKLETSVLTKSRIKTELTDKGVNEQTIEEFINVLNEAEFAQYGGSSQSNNLDMIYQKAAAVIQKLENSKNTLKGKTALMLGFIILISSLTVNAAPVEPANLFTKANKYYAENNFKEAEKLYTQIIDAGYISSEVYYNLANTCYRRQKFTDAIYFYEKAALYNPGDKDIKHNLNFAKLTMHKRIQDSPKLFLSKSYADIVNSYTADTWAFISIVSFALALIMVLVYLFSNIRRMKIIGFTFALALFLSSLFTFLFSKNRNNLENGQSLAIVFSENVPLRSSPDETATILIRISAGHKIEIRDHSGNWIEVELGNGQVGWLPADAVKIL